MNSCYSKKQDSRKSLGRSCRLPVIGALLCAVFLGFVPEANALKRPPGRLDRSSGQRAAFVLDLSFPQQASDIIPGLFELIPSGWPEVPVQPAWLYQMPEEAVSSGTDYFAKRFEVPVQGPFVVLGSAILVNPREEGELIPFPEILLTTEVFGGGPDLGRPVFRRTLLAPQPGSSVLYVDFSDADTLFQGPEVLYLVVRFPEGLSTGASIMLDTDQDYGLYPGSNYLATDNAPFLSFERAAEIVRPAFFGLDSLAPPGLAGDQLAVALSIGADTLNVPVYPPWVNKILPPVEGDVARGLGVQLGILPVWADGRPLGYPAERIRVTHVMPDTQGDSLIAQLDLEPDGWIHIPGLENRTYLLRFAVMDKNGRTGLPSGAYYVLPADPNEPNDSRDEAAELDLSVPVSGLWKEARTGPAVVQNPADFDFFHLELLAGDSLVAGFEGLAYSLSDLDPVLSLTDSSGLVLGHAEGTAAEVSLTASYTGGYYLLVNDRAIFSGEAFINEAGRVYRLAARVSRRRGDMDGNGRIDYRDAFLVFIITSGMRDTLSFTPAQRFAADYDGDGQVVGDIADFLGVLYQAGYVPARDPSRAAKSKDSGSAPSLASGRSWRLEFADGSSLVLSLSNGVAQQTPGDEAALLLSLLDTLEPALDAVKPAPGTRLPKAAGLCQNFPNPFNPSTAISFLLQEPGWAELEVFDVHGKLVRSLYRGFAPSGEQSVFWDGTDRQGRKAASGIYFYRLQSRDFVQTRKMLLIK